MKAFAFAGFSLVATVAAVTVVACSVTTNDAPTGSGNGDSGVLSQSELPCDVDAVLANNCRKCHSNPPQFSSGIPLVTLADLTGSIPGDSSKKVYQAVAERIADDAAPMPPAPNARLSDADRATLTSWAAAGAPAGDPGGHCATTPADDGGTVVPPLSCTPDLDLSPASPWSMPSATGDIYVCYGVDVSRSTPTHVVGFQPKIDNTKIVHHVVLFEADDSYSTTPTECGGATLLQWRMVTGWAPGGKGFELPPEAGFPLKTTTADPTHYVVQIHYSNPSALSGQTDQTGFSLCTGAPRANEADVMAFGTQNFSIPATNSPFSKTCTLTVPSQLAGVHLLAAMPHMHQIGHAMSTTLTHPGGAPIDIGTDTNFTFANQPWLSIPGDVTSAANDVITTTCTWVNGTGKTVGFGQYTADEMCYSFTTYYPKIQTGAWSWALPALESNCN